MEMDEQTGLQAITTEPEIMHRTDHPQERRTVQGTDNPGELRTDHPRERRTAQLRTGNPHPHRTDNRRRRQIDHPIIRHPPDRLHQTILAVVPWVEVMVVADPEEEEALVVVEAAEDANDINNSIRAA